MNLTELGEITASEYNKEHTCAANSYPQCDRLVHCTSQYEQPMDSWQLHNLHFADAEEVALGDAEEVGELTYHSMIVVNFCPFCGEKLQ
ncbi:hypothetical protein [Oceanobacter kriegii]|uniref:hypothetical protein n=1 Tax=Oceanobacter kriegii TaxID=64972 RepID=UPI00040C6F2B|nr:hypothetical protein [Oceanobacter kriegii]